MPGNQQTADQVGDYREVGEKGSAGLFFDPTAFAQPQGVRFGETGRNQFRGPGVWNLDFSVFRGFRLGGVPPGGVQGRGLQHHELAALAQPARHEHDD